ncbi:MAG: hypothetical protein K9M49_06410 [Candidatus Marinimicrobia bacterium]|nr:hypothetical protein [Candidatus Neomarinimicrobiota bacterium]MCF7851301.1 hypothetical protein [Candidatus Neomarinimicrobiota bacterium]MCF7904769.1 hypothetical protein [Candidatus Neomarinimicrobiota bacterium]
MRKTFLLSFILLSLIFVNNCEEPEESNHSYPKFEITPTTAGVKSYGSPYVKITVKNTGNAIGYNVSCDVQAKRGNLIVDSGFAYFANGGNITPGESAVDEAIFFNLSSHSDYDNLEYELDWL